MMKNTLIEEIKRIHSITYGDDLLTEQFLNKIANAVGLKKVDEPGKADLVEPNIDDFYNTLENAANSGGLFQQKQGSITYQKAVESLQIGLELMGYELPRFGVDGLFGIETATAVNRFKESNNIPSDNTHASPEMINLLIKQLKSKTIASKDIKPYVDKTISNIPQTDVSLQITNFFVNKGLTPEQASGIAGNLYKESTFNPNAVGDGGKAYGLAQWRDNRLVKLRNYNPNWKSIETQLEFIWYELNTTENKALMVLKQTKTPQDAATVFAKYYERPSSKNYQNRENLAQNIHNNYEQNRV